MAQHPGLCVRYLFVYSECIRQWVHLSVYVCVCFAVCCLCQEGGHFPFMDLSKVILEEHIAAWMLFDCVLHFTGREGLFQLFLRKDQLYYAKAPGQVHIFPSNFWLLHDSSCLCCPLRSNPSTIPIKVMWKESIVLALCSNV